MIGSKIREVNLGSHTAIQTGQNNWTLVIRPHLPFDPSLFEEFKQKTQQLAEKLIRYMRVEGILSNKNLTIKVIITNENCT